MSSKVRDTCALRLDDATSSKGIEKLDVNNEKERAHTEHHRGDVRDAFQNEISCGRELPESPIPSSETVHLSLPESFDDTFTVDSIAISDLARNTVHSCWTVKSGSENMNTVSTPDFSFLSRAEQETCFLALSAWVESQKKAIHQMHATEHSLERLQHVSKEKLTIAEVAYLATCSSVSDLKEDHRQEVSHLRRKMEALEFDVSEANRSKALAIERYENLKAEMSTADGRQQVLDRKVRDLQTQLLRAKENESGNDALLMKSRTMENEMASLKKRLEHQAELLSTAASREATSVAKHLESEKQTQELRLDNTFLKKEITLLKKQTEETKKESHRVEVALRDANIRRDELLQRLSDEKEEAKARNEQKLETEISRLRESFTRELSETRNSSMLIFERENRRLCEDKREAVAEIERVQCELKEVRCAHEKMIMQQSSLVSEQEHNLRELRNEAKAKDFEIAKLTTLVAGLQNDVKNAKLQNEYMRQQVLLHQSEFMKLENEAKSVRVRVEEEFSRTTQHNRNNSGMDMHAHENRKKFQDDFPMDFLPVTFRSPQHAIGLAHQSEMLGSKEKKIEGPIMKQKIEETLNAKGHSLEKDMSVESFTSPLRSADDEISTVQIERAKNRPLYALDRGGVLEDKTDVNEAKNTKNKENDVDSIVTGDSSANYAGETTNLSLSCISISSKNGCYPRNVDLSIHTIHHKSCAMKIVNSV